MGIPKRDRETSSRWEGPCVLRPARLPRQPASSGTCCGRHNRGAALPGVPGVPGAPGLRPCAALSPAALDLERRRAARAWRRHSSFERNQTKELLEHSGPRQMRNL